MEYNTQRKKLVIPEYGRHIQQLVDHCLTIEDDEERNKFSRAIIDVMGDLNPHLRDVPDFQHKLWDQLFMMSNFELEVESPYPIPTREELSTLPKKMAYPPNESKYRYYGTNVKKMIEVAKSWDEGEKKEGLKYAIANQMKKNYLKWNKDQVEDEVIFNHLEELSEGNLKLSEGDSLMNVPVQNTNANSGVNNFNSHKNKKVNRNSNYKNQKKNNNHPKKQK
ncbi:MAG: DUF4290 domain-containing protein [Flavobacteriaceae bacterium]|jgi:hypothetical protein|nr:DUF4290 domain-containing protein [Flavobacteriaceae bacterium]